MRQSIIIAIIFIFFFYTGIVTAQQNFSYFLPNAQSIGMGGSGVALSNDPAASYWNPASIAFLTTNRILINVNNESYLDYIGFTKFFPPSFGLGLNLFRFASDHHYADMASIATSYRLSSLLSVGMNVNFSKTLTDTVFSSFGVGLFFKSFPYYQRTPTWYNSFWNWFRSEYMKDKFALGISLHNFPINNKKKNYQIRIGTAIKPFSFSPLIQFAYHQTPYHYSLHLGTSASLSKLIDLYFGVKDLNINQFTLGGAMHWGALQTDVGYEYKYSRIYFSFIFRLGEEKKILFQKYKELGMNYVKSNDFNKARHAYLKALAYEPDNNEINYLISVLNNESSEASQKIDSLFTIGKSYEQKGWYMKAVLSYQKILEIDENNQKAQKRLKSLDSKLIPYLEEVYGQGVMYFNQNDLHRARLIFQQILLVDKNYSEARTYLTKIDSVNSNTASNYYYRGLGYYNQRNFTRAQEEFKDALTFDPNHELARQYLEKTEREIESNRQLIIQYLREAQNYEQRKQYLNATLSYRKILELDKTHSYARERLVYLDRYIRDEIEVKFLKARQIYDAMDYYGAIGLLKEILSIDPDHKSSKNYLKLATQKLSNLAEQHFQRAQNFFDQKKWEIVLQECNLTLSMNPEHAGAKELRDKALANMSLDNLLSKGIKYYQQGDYLSARSVFKQILVKEPYNSVATSYLDKIETNLKNRVEELFNMGMVKYAEGNYEGAIQEWNKVFEIEPDHQSAKEYIQKARERIEAIKRIEK